MTSTPSGPGLRAGERPVRRAAALVLALLALSAGAVSASSPPSPAPPPSSLAPELPEELVAMLLTPDELGVPVDWALRDVDSELAATESVPAEVLDPFLGTLECDGAPLAGEAPALWLARRYSAPEVPLENGLLSVDITVVVESSHDAAERTSMLDDCSGPHLGVFTHDSDELTVGAGTVEAAKLEVLAPPSEMVPYAAAFNATIAHAGGTTVIVVLGGVDMGESWQDLADATAVAALSHIAGERASSSISTPASVPDSTEPS